MKLKLILLNGSEPKIFYFNETESKAIMSCCESAGKQWSQYLLGFFINNNENRQYVAITVKDVDGTIESMEYIDIEKNQPEFDVSEDFLAYVSQVDNFAEISLVPFDPILQNIIHAPVKARNWHVYPTISQYYVAN